MSNTLGKIDSFADKRKIITVDIPEFGGSFRLRELKYEQTQTVDADDPQRLFKLLSLAIVDDAGQRIYTTDEDIANLSEMGMGAFNALVDAAGELNGITAKAAENTAKKSEASQTSDSASV